MEERRGRRSMMWSRNRDSNSSTEPSTPSAIPSPKEMDTTQSSGGNRSPSASDEESSPSNETSSRRSRPSLVMRAEEIVHRVMATPPRSIPPARLSPPRYEQPTTANASATTPAPGQVSSLVAPRNGSENKSKLKKGRSYEIPILLVFFCITAIVYIALAFSLTVFPNFVHFFFILCLLIEFVFIIKALVAHVRRLNRQKAAEALEAREEGPPVGAVIEGAPNWDGLTEDPSNNAFDLERIGVQESLKPVPPAYGVYRGSIRIADSDIRWMSVTRGEDDRGIVEEEEEPNGVRRPPSYASQRETI